MAAEDAVTNWFKSLPFKLKREIAQEIKEQAFSLVDAQRNALQSALTPPEETGDLLASIRVEDGKHDLEQIVLAGGESTTKDGYDHALGFEFGNQKQAARPFFYSTFQEQRENIQKAIADRVEDVLSRA